jgi:hypothetical protein
MRITFQRMLDEAGVRTICNLTAVESLIEGGQIAAVQVDTKTVHRALRIQHA